MLAFDPLGQMRDNHGVVSFFVQPFYRTSPLADATLFEYNADGYVTDKQDREERRRLGGRTWL